MPVIAVDEQRGTFDHRCAICQTVTPGLKLDPAQGHLIVTHPLPGVEDTLTVRECPACLAKGKHVTESLTLNLPAWEAGEGEHPQSLVGTHLPGSRGVINIVTEHTIGSVHDPQRQQWARFHRAMQRHPHLAPHAPLRVP